MLLVSSQPLVARDGVGKLAPVDLSLGRTAAGVAPVNSGVPFVVDPDSAAKVRFTRLGVGMRVAGARDSRAKTAPARAAAARVADDRAFFANVLTDTDAGVMPLPNGAELFLIARSDQAPQRFVLGLDLPAGASLRRAVSRDPIRGGPPRSFEIVRDGKTLAYVHAPVAHDADGRGVPAQMTISGDDIILDVPHRGRDVAYPLSIDPEVQTPNNQTWGWGGWTWRHNRAATGDAPWAAAAGNCAYYCGLYQALPRTGWITNGSHSRWSYQMPPKTYVGRVKFGGIAHNPWVYAGQSITAWYQGIGTANDAFDTTVSPGGYTNQNGATGGGGYALFSGKQAAWGWMHDVDATDPNPALVEGNKAFFGMGASNPMGPYSLAVNLPANAGTTTMSWSQVYLGDNYAPAWHPTTPVPADVGWADDTNTAHSRSLRATDQGLGLYQLKLTGAASISAPPASQGTVAGDTITAPCTGNPPQPICPTDWPGTETRYTLNEGINTLTARATDLTRLNGTPIRTWTEKIDRTAPTLDSVSGSLFRGTSDSSPVHPGNNDVTVSASDAGAGVTRLELFVDGELMDSAHQPCAAGSCSMGPKTFWFNTSELTAGKHEIKLVATDGFGRVTPSAWNISAPSPRTTFTFEGAVTAPQAANAAHGAGAPVLEFRHSGSTEGGYRLGDEDPDAALEEYREAYQEEHGTGSQPTISAMIVGGDVTTAELGRLGVHVDTRHVVEVLEDLDDEVSDALESTLEYLDDLLNADLFAETQPSDPRDDEPARDGLERQSQTFQSQASSPPVKKFAPTYGGIETDSVPNNPTRKRKIFQTLTFSKAALGQSDLDHDGDVDDDDRALSPFERSGAADHGYEHDLKLIDPDYDGSSKWPACPRAAPRFWAKRGGLMWDTNFERDSNPYLDATYLDECRNQDFSIGLEYPLDLRGGKKYRIMIRALAGEKTTSKYQLNAQKVFRAASCGGAASACAFDQGPGSEGQILVGPTKGRTEECRRWRNGKVSRRTCDHLGE